MKEVTSVGGKRKKKLSARQFGNITHPQLTI